MEILLSGIACLRLRECCAEAEAGPDGAPPLVAFAIEIDEDVEIIVEEEAVSNGNQSVARGYPGRADQKTSCR